MSIRIAALAASSAFVLSCGGGSAATTPDQNHPANAAAKPAAADEPAKPMTPEALVAAERSAFEAAKPVLQAHCARCHDPAAGNAKASAHLVTGSYPLGGPHAHELGKRIPSVLGIGGGQARMPKDKPGSLSAAELELIATWAKAFEASHAAGAGHHKGHGEHSGHDNHDGGSSGHNH